MFSLEKVFLNINIIICLVIFAAVWFFGCGLWGYLITQNTLFLPGCSKITAVSAPRVAIVHEYLTRYGGAERVAKVLADLFPAAPVFTLLYDCEKVGAFFPPARVRPSFLQKLPTFLRRRVKFLLPLLPAAVEAWDFSAFDIVLSSSSAFAHGLVLPPHVRHICYCHSPARFLWDYTHAYKKENNLTGLKKLMAGFLLKRLRIWNRLAAYRVDRWLANSQTVAKRIAKYYRAAAEVVYPPVGTARFRLSDGHENYFLIVSQLTPYKKIDLAISVFNKLRRRLVIVGDGPDRARLAALAGPTIELAGWRSEAEVVELVRHARAQLLPGEEDFGIAPVEAMAAGRPVIAYGRGGATETVRLGETGELFAEPTAASFEAALARFFVNEPRYDSAKIRRHARQFDEKIFRQKMQAVVAAEWAKMQNSNV